MRRPESIVIVAALISFLSAYGSAKTFTLTGDTPQTGSTLGTSPLVTELGTITFDGDVDTVIDLDIKNLIHPSTNTFKSKKAEWHTFSFNFDVTEVSFLYGGNLGSFIIEALDIDNNLLDSFYQADTTDGQPAGLTTLYGFDDVIRSLRFKDAGPLGEVAELDSIMITSIPEPGTIILLGLGGLALIKTRRKR